LPDYISKNWSFSDFEEIRQQFPPAATESPESFITYCKDLNSKNSKFPPWKTLQGILWRKSYENGSVKAQLYDDVLLALQKLKSVGVGIYIYSSGSIEAQKLLFEHTTDGDIRHLIAGCNTIAFA